jgi:hypothetical protein
MTREQRDEHNRKRREARAKKALKEAKKTNIPANILGETPLMKTINAHKKYEEMKRMQGAYTPKNRSDWE